MGTVLHWTYDVFELKYIVMIAQTIIKYKWLIIATVGVLLSSSIWLLPQLTTNIEFSNFFPQGDKEVLYYKNITEKLGNNDHFIAVVIVPEKNIFTILITIP